jgi:thioredoxin-related protein
MSFLARACNSAWIVAAALVVSPVAAADLIMFEEPGCMWCARWDRDVGDAYHMTAEGRRAPLLRRYIGDGAPEGVTLASSARFTPTFVLVEGGREVGRIEGYPGEDFFWPMLGVLLDRLPPEAGATTGG